MLTKPVSSQEPPASSNPVVPAVTQRLLRQYILQRAVWYGIGVVAIAIAEVAQVQIPNVLGEFINQLKQHMSPETVLSYAGLLAIFGVGWVGAFTVGQVWLGNLSRGFETALRQQLFVHWESLSSHYFQGHSAGDLLNHLGNDTASVREALSSGANQVLQAIFLFPITLYMTIRYINLHLTLIAMVPMVCIPLVIRIFGRRVEQRARVAKNAFSSLSAFTEESFQAIRLVKAMANEVVEADRFSKAADHVVGRQMEQVRLNALFQALMPFLSGLSFVVGIIWGGELVVHHQISLGAFVAFTTYLSLLIRPLMQIGFVVNLFQNAAASLNRINMLLAVPPDITDPAAPIRPPKRGAIHVEDLTFTYPGASAPALVHVTVDVPAGTILGVAGRTGAGKTTLLNLLIRDYNPPPATIFVDGVDVLQMSLEDLRSRLAYVPQDGFLFSTTLADNIAFAHTKTDAGRIAPAIAVAQLADTVSSLPQGLETVIGERGVRLSGGQRQRTAIARALAKTDADMLILDDSLSAVDTATETALLEALLPTRRGLTTIIAAHRVSTLRHCDWIMVLDQGRLVEQGTPAELVMRDGLYAEMARMQSQEAANRG